jgi:peptide/nickel transport system permease protein
MLSYIAKNIFHSVLIILGVITLSFILIYLVPGDPVKLILGQRADEKTIEIVNKEMGFDKPVYVRYVNYVIKTFKGDLGKSFISNRDVLATILDKFPATALLSFIAITLASIIGVFLGLLASIKSYSILDNIFILISLVGISIPQFVLGLFMAFIFGAVLKILPVTGYVNNGLQFLILPVLTLSLRPMAIIARITRSSMIEVRNQDYVVTARAKGLSNLKVVIKHILRNALNPTVTAISSSLAATLGGVFFIEYIFNWPGIGLLAIDSIMKLDYPMIQGTVLFSALIFVVINFFVDIIYAFLDPKVKLS